MTLQLAYSYQDELNKKYLGILFQDKYKFLSNNAFLNYQKSLDNNSWNNISYVSLDKNDKVVGFFSASIKRPQNKVEQLYVANFEEPNYNFGHDLFSFINILFCKMNFYKIEFSVIVGNPIEKTYDKYVKKYNGNIIGISKDTVMLYDNNLYDEKLYEIFRKNYIEEVK
jgi:hypothetical protein